MNERETIIASASFAAGWDAALDAAREAIDAMHIGRDVRFSVDVRADAIAVIDALRDKP